MGQEEVLGDEAAHGEGEDVHGAVPQPGDEVVGVLRGFLDRARDDAAGGAHPLLVEGDDVAPPGDGIHDAGVPVIERGREVGEEHHGDVVVALGGGGAEFPVGEGLAVGGEGGGGGVGVGGEGI